MRSLVILLLVIVVIIIAISSRGGSLLRRLLLLLLALALSTGIAGNRTLEKFQDLLVCDLLVGGELAEVELGRRAQKLDAVLGDS